MELIKPKILWITPDYFLCVDASIVPFINTEFEITWILVNTFKSKRNAEGLIHDSFKPIEFNLKYRQKDPRIISQYYELIKISKKENYDLIYISFHGFPYFFPLFFNMIDCNKIILGIHNVTTPKGASNELWMDRYQRYALSRINHFHVFSKFQLEAIKKIAPNKKHYYAPLTLDDYGNTDTKPPKNIIRFLFFGYIKNYKRVDLLIKAFRNLKNSGNENIELLIAGNCDNWLSYQELMENDSSIKTRIEIIPNKDIPDIVASCHYVVLPYQDGAQSAVLTLAYRYFKPVIVSNIESFKQYVIEGKTGYFFENQSLESLTQVMNNALANHNNTYSFFEKNIKLFIEEEFSTPKILTMYTNLLHNCLQKTL